MIFFDQVVKGEVREKASIGNAEEKKDFFDRQSEYIDAHGITRVKAPYPQFGEKCVPRDKQNGGNRNCGKNKFPFPRKICFGIEAENKRDYK